MKIYTFNAPSDTRVELLWALTKNSKDPIFEKFVAQGNYKEVNSIRDCDLAVYPYKVFNPETLAFDSSIYNAVDTAEQYSKPLVLDATSDSDVYLNIPTAKILRCGLYKSLQQTFEIECPFWSNYRTKQGLDALKIKPKGSQPKVGFCGTVASIGKLSQIGKYVLPTKLAQVALAEGKFAQKVDVRIKEGMSLRLRAAAMKILSSNSKINTHFDISNPHESYYFDNDRNRRRLEQLFITNTDKSDYTLCVRGTGNYSGRFYMALNAGCIPVVLDTDVVIPFEEKLHLVKVPVQSLDKIDELILEHFEGTSEREFRTMKAQNRFAYHQYLAPEKFLPSFLGSIVESGSQQTATTTKIQIPSI